MDDLISRQAAIDAMAELQGRASTKAELKGISKAWKRIKELQPIQPEPAQWVQMLINPRMYRCSNCNIAWNKRLVFDLDNGNEMVMKYCPCCGKKMLAEVDYE